MKILFYISESKIIEAIKKKAALLCANDLFSGLDSVQIFINAGNRPDFLPNARLAVLLSEDSLLSNSGATLTEYKKKVCEILAEEGIILSFNNSDDIVARAVPESFSATNGREIHVQGNEKPQSTVEADYEEKSRQFIPVVPAYSFDRVIINETTKERILSALSILKCEEKVFNEWGLYEIQPHPSSALSFFGPSGTGKTMAAEAIASVLGKKILKVSYADVESKYHGEGPKMVKAIFLAASREDAVLFFDEADSLLSKRLTNVSQGSEQAINSMRSELLLALENYHGIVIFATNLVINYDKAFLTRLISIEFTLPDEETRKKIWDVHIRPVDDGKEHKLNIPLGDDVNTQILAEKYEFSGREIRNAVISACVNVAMDNRDKVMQIDFEKASDKILNEVQSVKNASDHTTSDSADFIREAIKAKLEKKEAEKDVSGDA